MTMTIDFTNMDTTARWSRKRAELIESWWMPAFMAAGYEPRLAQLLAFETTQPMFATAGPNRVGLMAGTGVGKSLIAFALADAAIKAGYSKVIISTASISLAQQYEADMLAQDDYLPNSYAVSSGLDNTLCLLALQHAQNGSTEVPVTIEARSTRFSQWPISKDDKGMSVRAASDIEGRWPCYPDSKQGFPACEFLHECPVYAQRDTAYNSSIIVANHVQTAWLLARQAYFDSSDVFLICDEADRAVQMFPLEMWGAKYKPVSLDDVLSIPKKIVFMSGTLTKPIADRLGCNEYKVLPHLDRSNAPILMDNDQRWWTAIADMAVRYADRPGMVVVPNHRQRDSVRDSLTKLGIDTVDFDMNQNRAAVKAAHVAAHKQGIVPPVLLGFHAGAGVGLDLPGDLLGWLAVVGRPRGAECAEDRRKVIDQAERSDNLIVQALGRSCRFDGDACRVVWFTSSANNVDGVVERMEREGATMLFGHNPSEMNQWLGDEPALPWKSRPPIVLSDDW